MSTMFIIVIAFLICYITLMVIFGIMLFGRLWGKAARDYVVDGNDDEWI